MRRGGLVTLHLVLGGWQKRDVVLDGQLCKWGWCDAGGSLTVIEWSGSLFVELVQ